MGDIRHWAGTYNESIIEILALTPKIYRFEYVCTRNTEMFAINILADGRIGQYHSL